MGVVLEGAGTFVGSASTATPGIPAGTAAGDILLLFVESENETVTLSTANGFTLVATPTGTGTASATDAVRITAFWKRAVGGDSAPVVADAGDHVATRILRFSGVKASGDPWNGTPTWTVDAVSDTTLDAAGPTTTVTNCMVVIAAANVIDTNTAQTLSFSNGNLSSLGPSGFGDNTQQGTGGGFNVGTGIKGSAGAVGNTTVTYGTATQKSILVMALEPEPITRSVSVDAISTIASVGQDFSVYERSSSVGATALVSSSGQVESGSETFERSFSLTASANVVTSGIEIIAESSAFNASAQITTAGQKVVQRSASLSATGSIATSSTQSTRTSEGRVSLGFGNTPETRTDHRIVLRARKASGSGTVTIRAALYEDGINRSGYLESAPLTTSLEDYELPISDEDAEDITSYSNLEIKFYGYSVDGEEVGIEIAEIGLGVPYGVIVPVYEASASLNATSDISSDGEFFSVLSRSAAISATSAVTVTGQRDLQRSVSINASADVLTQGQEVLARAASFSATSAITSDSERQHHRQSVVSASASISASPQRELRRSTSLDATALISVQAEQQGIKIRSASFDATSTVTVAHKRVLLRSSSLSASGTISASAIRIFARTSTISGISSVTVAARRVLIRQVYITATAQVGTSAVEVIERSASLSASSSVTASGTSLTIFERASILSSVAAITSDGTVIISRSGALTVDADIETASQRDLLRSSEITNAARIQTQAEFLSFLEAQVSLEAIALIGSVGTLPYADIQSDSIISKPSSGIRSGGAVVTTNSNARTGTKSTNPRVVKLR